MRKTQFKEKRTNNQKKICKMFNNKILRANLEIDKVPSFIDAVRTFVSWIITTYNLQKTKKNRPKNNVIQRFFCLNVFASFLP